MTKSRWFVLFLAGAAILSFTQYPFGSIMQARTDCAAATYRVCEVNPQ